MRVGMQKSSVPFEAQIILWGVVTLAVSPAPVQGQVLRKVT